VKFRPYRKIWVRGTKYAVNVIQNTKNIYVSVYWTDVNDPG